MPTVLVAVDAENLSHKLLTGINQLGSKMGEVIGRKAFGDFEMLRMRPWIDISIRNDFTLVDSPHIKSKNIADMTMIIEILEFVYESKPDIVVIGTGDGDFIPLVNKLRSKGIVVVGAGTQEASHHFKSACNFYRVQEIENVLSVSAHKKQLPKSVGQTLSRVAAKVLKEYRRDEWVPISRIGDELSNQSISLDLKNLGVGSLSEAIENLFAFEIQKNGKQISFRKKGFSKENQISYAINN